jgi:hypothetical protein
MTALHPSIEAIDMPPQMEALPRNHAGFPVPWFVAHIDGDPDFRVIKPGAVEQALRFGLCWLCGHELGMTATYVAGPMCAINRVSAEPPSHHACATYAGRACPFMTRPHARRRDGGLADDLTVPGKMIERNPGVAMLWSASSVAFPFDAPNGRLFRLPDPIRVEWLCEGRPATYQEVRASIESGIPILRDAALAEGPEAMRALFEQTKALHRWLPRETSAA